MGYKRLDNGLTELAASDEWCARAGLTARFHKHAQRTVHAHSCAFVYLGLHILSTPKVQGLFVHAVRTVQTGVKSHGHGFFHKMHMEAMVMCLSWVSSPWFEKCPAVRINNYWSVQHTEHRACTCPCTHAEAVMNNGKQILRTNLGNLIKTLLRHAHDHTDARTRTDALNILTGVKLHQRDQATEITEKENESINDADLIKNRGRSSKTNKKRLPGVLYSVSTAQVAASATSAFVVYNFPTQYDAVSIIHVLLILV